MSVVVVASRLSDAELLSRLGYRLARALEESLVVLAVERSEADAPTVVLKCGEPPPPEASDDLIALLTGLEALTAVAAPADETTAPALANPPIEIRALVTTYPLRAVIAAVEDVGGSHLLVAKHASRRPGGGASLARKLFTKSPVHTLLVRTPTSVPSRFDRVLVPTSGGPHARVALRLAARLARAEAGTAVPLRVESAAGELADAVGERLLQRALDRAGLVEDRSVAPRVILAERPAEGIRQAAGDDFDLLLLGASDASALRGQLFGTLPASMLDSEQPLTVAVLRRRWSTAQRLRAAIGRWLDLRVPQMSRDDRIQLYATLESGSAWRFDFMILICLSTAIATLGLLQNSPAVVIGAMLVAPLMTPILGAGLALVQGNLPLLRSAARSILSGYLLALLIGFVGGLAVPTERLTAELAARGGPTHLDLGIALLSGLAAAYCLGRPGLLAALPGVAIAAALVPPIATTGVSLALGEPTNAGGSVVLFGTNVVAIVLGAAIAFYGGGVRGKRGASRGQTWVRYAFLALLMGAMLLSIVLADRAYNPLENRSNSHSNDQPHRRK